MTMRTAHRPIAFFAQRNAARTHRHRERMIHRARESFEAGDASSFRTYADAAAFSLRVDVTDMLPPDALRVLESALAKVAP